ncbi:hypothetical protein ASF06_05445 [Agreia sp. Leaf244]|uniref:hypothetical protein n=1 Tax=Agreia sp. Leaf244 TaxID=1736305 RepID=UPI0007000E2A|nr:hypothetical protein [Agreia sp. Leaf244]KQO09703.1 hypothetical protein ASF06_05445 [Agreia sp. Leaf244]
MAIPLTPDQTRIAARESAYANSIEEKENIARVDGEFFDRVRIFENHALSNARQFMDGVHVDLVAADELETAIRREVRFALNEGANPEAVAYRHTALVASAKAAIERLERAERESEWHANRLNDPYSQYAALVSKFPTLRPPVSI